MNLNQSRIEPGKIRLVTILIIVSWLLATALALLCRVPSSEGADTSFSSLNLATAIQDVAKSAIPAVVHIEVTERREIANPLSPFQNDPFFQYFFGNRKMPKKIQKELVGLGSGMILDTEGHILTNNHVVGGATKIVVVLADGRKFSENSVKLIGTDSKTDLAVIKIPGKGDLPTLALGDSDQAEVGQWVIAIGHPRGLDQTVTQGIISAKHRRGISDPSSYQDFLQTDAAINPGNSGGPLLNLQGQVIGICAAIMSQSGGFEGLGFAIPSNMAAHVSKQLIALGKVERGWLGVTIQDVTPDLSHSMGLSTTKGALIADVTKNGPAARAGIQGGDVITAFEDKPVDGATTLQNAVTTSAVGRKVKLTILRKGKQQEIAVTIANQEELEKSLAGTLKQKYGLTVRRVKQKQVDKYSLDSESGVVVVSVTPGSTFAKAGFEVGDLILQIDDQPVGGPESLATILNSLPAKKKVTILAVDHKSAQAGKVEVTLP